MGMSVSIATAIIFIASIIAFVSFDSALDEAQSSWMDAQRVSSDRVAAMSKTDISIASIDEQNGTIEVMNSGQVTLSLDNVNVLLNGTLSNEHISSMRIEEHPDSRIWLPDDILTIRFASDLSNTDIKIVTGNGITTYG